MSTLKCILIGLIAAGSMIIPGCGKRAIETVNSDTQVFQGDNGDLLQVTSSNMPACNINNLHQTVYISDQGAIKSCDGTNWVLKMSLR
ncbi:MAG: hypothetical protein HQK54_03055 [Oligoflexales bacterium]|nr:hypothetical protein [Oligoflexales bacterium]